MSSISFYGADVAKARISVARHTDTRGIELANAPEALQGWLAALPAGSVIAMEATGCYHRLLATLAHARGLAVYVINPQHVAHYARAIGARAKTDRIDAQLIARYVAAEHAQLVPWQPAPALNQRLSELLARRAALVRARAAIEQSLGTLSLLATEREVLLASCRRMLRAIEALLLKLIHSDAALSALYARLERIAGVGPVLAAQLTELLSRLRFRCADALIAYSGLDPRPDESGARRARRRVSKHGSASLRHLLWMAGLTTSHCKCWQPAYQALRARGLSGTEAALIMGRKIARVAFAIARSGQAFDPAKLSAHA